MSSPNEPKCKIDHFHSLIFDSTLQNELKTSYALEEKREVYGEYYEIVSYISDIHLPQRLLARNAQTEEDITRVLESTADELASKATYYNIVAGDTSSDIGLFKQFVQILRTKVRESRLFFFVLGNHEFWGYEKEGLSKAVKEYRQILAKNKMFLLHNNLYLITIRGVKEISEDQLNSISKDTLRKRLKCIPRVLFGGTGFAGANHLFNANAGIYQAAIDRNEEITESKKFFGLYEKVVEAAAGHNLIVATHMPMSDWGATDSADGVVYISGHTHKNYCFDDGRKRIYADNQIGYKGKTASLKQLIAYYGYDWFQDYSDGIYEIKKSDYYAFGRGILGWSSLSREVKKLFMLKRSGTYMFIMLSPKDSLLLLNGGMVKKLKIKDLNYYYDRMPNYANSVKMFLSGYEAYQKELSKEIKSIGGSGRIHGCIVDITFLSHLYVNPFDGTITAYSAWSMTSKHVYRNVRSLLKYECPNFYPKYEELLETKNGTNAIALREPDAPLSSDTVFVSDTSMYRISRIISGLQYTTRHNVIRVWSDGLAESASEEGGRLIIASSIDPTFICSATPVAKARDLETNETAKELSQNN